MPPLPAPSFGLDRAFVTGPIGADAAQDQAWAEWQAHVDAGRIGDRAAAPAATRDDAQPETSPAST